MLSKAMHKMFHVIKRSSDFFFSDEDDVYNSDISVNDSSSEDVSDIPDSVNCQENKTDKHLSKSDLSLYKLQQVRPRASIENGRNTIQNQQSGSRKPLSGEKFRQFQNSQSTTNSMGFTSYQKCDKKDGSIFKSYNLMEENSDNANNVDDNSFDSSEGRLVIDEKDTENTDIAVNINVVGLENIDNEAEKEDDNVSQCSFHTSPLKVIDLCGTSPSVNLNNKDPATSGGTSLREDKNVQEKIMDDDEAFNVSENKSKRPEFNVLETVGENGPKNKKMKKVQLKKSNIHGNKDKTTQLPKKNRYLNIYVCEEKSGISDEDSDAEEYFRSRNGSSSVPGCSKTGDKPKSTAKRLFLMKTKDIIKLVERKDHPLHEFAGIITEENIDKLSKKERKVFLHILAKLIDEAALAEKTKRILEGH